VFVYNAREGTMSEATQSNQEMRRLVLKFIAAAMIFAGLTSACAPIVGASYRLTTDSDFYRDSPQQARPPDGTLAAGTTVVVLQWAGSYTQVRTEDGDVGFIETGSITPPNIATPAVPESEFTHQIVTDTEHYKVGPQQAQPPDGILAAGTRVVVLEDAGSYVRVRSEDGVEGYVASDSLEAVLPD
jgi:hypothetical protein